MPSDDPSPPKAVDHVVSLFAPVPQISYATAPNAHTYRAIMRIVYENREAYGQPLHPAQVADQLRSRYGVELDDDAVASLLAQLAQWQVLDARQDATRVHRASDLVRKQLTYDITAAGEHCERFLAAFDTLVDEAGSLQGQRLNDILTELRRLHSEMTGSQPDPAALQAALTNLVAALDELRRGSRTFLRELQQLTHANDALDESAFSAYKQQVVDYLLGFRTALEQRADAISRAVADVEAAGVEQMLALVASIQAAPQYGVSQQESHRRALEPLRRQWRGVRSWFSEADGQPEFRLLDNKLTEAIEWILRTVQRLTERRSQRVDRSEEYRHLARLFAGSSDEDCHAIFHAAFGLFPPRHFGCPAEDPELVDASTSFWDAPAVPIEAHLRNPVRRARGAGRGSRVIDNDLARHALRERRLREREQLDLALRQLTSDRPLRLSDVGTLDEVAFDHLLSWLGRALETPPAAGRRQAESSDGSVLIVLRNPDEPGRRTTLSTPVGDFTGPDYELEIRPA